jgi:hypothetical protein
MNQCFSLAAAGNLLLGGFQAFESVRHIPAPKADLVPHMPVVDTAGISGKHIAGIAVGSGAASAAECAIVTHSAVISPILAVTEGSFQGVIPDLGKPGLPEIADDARRHINAGGDQPIRLYGAVAP